MSSRISSWKHALGRRYHFAGHFLFYVLFPVSTIGLISVVINLMSSAHANNGQRVEINHWAVVLVFLTLSIVSGYGMVRSIKRDVRYCRNVRKE